MAAKTVDDTAPVELVTGGFGTASNPTQFSLRFADGETGTIYLAYAPNAEAAATVCTPAEGWPWPDTEVFSGTVIAGQTLYGITETGTIEIRDLIIEP